MYKKLTISLIQGIGLLVLFVISIYAENKKDRKTKRNEMEMKRLETCQPHERFKSKSTPALNVTGMIETQTV
jgi:hypothetical protein